MSPNVQQEKDIYLKGFDLIAFKLPPTIPVEPAKLWYYKMEYLFQVPLYTGSRHLLEDFDSQIANGPHRATPTPPTTPNIFNESECLA